jgi:hypothetical protein
VHRVVADRLVEVDRLDPEVPPDHAGDAADHARGGQPRPVEPLLEAGDDPDSAAPVIQPTLVMYQFFCIREH